MASNAIVGSLASDRTSATTYIGSLAAADHGRPLLQLQPAGPNATAPAPANGAEPHAGSPASMPALALPQAHAPLPATSSAPVTAYGSVRAARNVTGYDVTAFDVTSYDVTAYGSMRAARNAALSGGASVATGVSASFTARMGISGAAAGLRAGGGGAAAAAAAHAALPTAIPTRLIAGLAAWPESPSPDSAAAGSTGTGGAERGGGGGSRLAASNSTHGSAVTGSHPTPGSSITVAPVHAGSLAGSGGTTGAAGSGAAGSGAASQATSAATHSTAALHTGSLGAPESPRRGRLRAGGLSSALAAPPSPLARATSPAGTAFGSVLAPPAPAAAASIRLGPSPSRLLEGAAAMGPLAMAAGAGRPVRALAAAPPPPPPALQALPSFGVPGAAHFAVGSAEAASMSEVRNCLASVTSIEYPW